MEISQNFVAFFNFKIRFSLTYLPKNLTLYVKAPKCKPRSCTGTEKSNQERGNIEDPSGDCSGLSLSLVEATRGCWRLLLLLLSIYIYMYKSLLYHCFSDPGLLECLSLHNGLLFLELFNNEN